jgi:hypothetical protein
MQGRVAEAEARVGLIKEHGELEPFWLMQGSAHELSSPLQCITFNTCILSSIGSFV